MRSKGHQHKYFDYSFKGKREEEEIILMLRRHWLILLMEFIPLGFFLICLLFIDIVGPFILDLFPFQIDQNLFNLGESFLYMFFWCLVFIVWIDYYLDVWIVTDQRIVNIEQKGLFRREISELEHSKIQDVTTEIHGIIATLLKFGYVYVQTAGERSRFVFKQVPNPVLVRTLIMKLQKQVIKREKIMEGEILRGKFS
ncbi:MAG: PH domain-containing protein [Patescibacteria group bacterium]|nr:PH domain-containing protein [Patescibacteria group bacterium]